MEIPESQNSRDQRIEQLWQKLDPQRRGELDINGLKKGLSKMDHPLKNANEMLEYVVKAMDKNGDERISYDEFRTFVEKTERELLSLFKSIDRDHDGRLDKGELRAAFQKAGLAVSGFKLDQFFKDVDQNHDGYITFSEWRNFLLFLPTQADTPELKQILSYYTSTITLNSESDSSISQDTFEGLAITTIFGSLFQIAEITPSRTPRSSQGMKANNPGAFEASGTPTNDKMRAIDAFSKTKRPASIQGSQLELPEQVALQTVVGPRKSFLRECAPDPGYFVAGGLSGAVSRTCTAPLDRLKVYLIANIRPASESINAVKKGDAVAAAKTIGRPLADATKDLWKAGGWKSLFAGNGLNVLKVMPESAIRFGAYEAAKRGLARYEGHDNPKGIHPFSKFLAGGFGGMVSQAVVYPIDTLKFRMQCETVEGGLHGNALIIQTAKKMYMQGGFRQAYRGLTMGLVGMFPYSAIDLGTFEYLKSKIEARNIAMGYSGDDAEPGSFATGCIGAFSGAFGASIVYPINLLRTRLQAQGTVLHPPTYTGIWDVAQRTVKNEGARGLFKGITPNLLKVVPAVSITYVVYEKSKQVMHLEERED